MQDATQPVVVIGGGVIGAAAAYFIREQGWPVTVVEQGRFGGGASHGNCGLIVPGHALPLNMPWAWVYALGWMVGKNPPVAIRPSADPDLLRWLIGFLCNCSTARMTRTARGCASLMRDAIPAWERWITRENLACDWENRGVLHLFRSSGALDAYRRQDRLARRFGPGCTPLDRRELLDLEPTVGSRVKGGWYGPAAAHLRPDHLMAALRNTLTAAGVHIMEKTAVTGFRIHGSRAVAALTDGGAVQGRAFVMATGAWTPGLARTLGFRVPIQPGKGYSVTFQRPDVRPALPCFFEEAKTVATPWSSGLRLGGTMEFCGYDPTLRRNRLDILYRAARDYLSPMQPGLAQEEWCGWRPMTWDGLPVIDWAPGVENVLLAAGHNMLGLTMAPATGRLVAEVLTGGTPHCDLEPFRLARAPGRGRKDPCRRGEPGGPAGVGAD